MLFSVIDLETTGLDPTFDRIIEIAVVKIDHGVVCEHFDTLINPGMTLPKEITALTGIQPDMLVEKPTIADITDALQAFIEGSILVAHNASFDQSFISSHIGRDYQWLDTVELAKIVLPYETSYSLDHLANGAGISFNERHRALDDAQATAQLLLFLLRKLEGTDINLLENVLKVSGNDAIHHIVTAIYKQKSRQFGHIKRKPGKLILAREDKPEGIFKQHASDNVTGESAFSPQQIESLFLANRPIQKVFPDFDFRPQQLEMAKQVAASFQEDRHLIVEAATGVGKSLAYLIPAILWATQMKKKVVISTHTLTLQEQLLNNDLPKAKLVLGESVNAAVLKGKNNYLCLRKWKLANELINEQGNPFARRLMLWVSSTLTGDIGELSLQGKETHLWSQLAADSHSCLGTKCGFFRGTCFVSRAKRKAEIAQILIVNHSLLMADADVNNSILPEYSYLVVDEAHHFDKTAEEHLGTTTTYAGFSTLYQKLKRGENSFFPSVMDQISAKLKKSKFLEQHIRTRLMERVESVTSCLDKCYSYFQEFFRLSNIFFTGEKTFTNGNSYSIRVTERHRAQPNWEKVFSAGENFSGSLGEVKNKLINLAEELILIEQECGSIFVDLLVELTTAISQVSDYKYTLEAFLYFEETTTVSWGDINGDGYPILRTAPLEVREQLCKYFFNNKKSVVLTSATLTVKDEFQFFIHNIGIDLTKKTVNTVRLDSPFNYEKNVLFVLPTDVPDPTAVSELEFTTAVAQSLIKLIKATDGRTMVLFTSHQQLKTVYEMISPVLTNSNISVLAHGISGGRHKILETFKNSKSAVILGANSFWEGVDVVGEALSCLIVVKLPFWPPNLPTVSARLDRYKNLKQNGFSEYSLPHAVIRFKQGFGRLIRSSHDFGIVSVFDRRIFEKKYGQVFLRSVPKTELLKGETDNLSEIVSNWLNTRSGGKC